MKEKWHRPRSTSSSVPSGSGSRPSDTVLMPRPNTRPFASRANAVRSICRELKRQMLTLPCRCCRSLESSRLDLRCCHQLLGSRSDVDGQISVHHEDGVGDSEVVPGRPNHHHNGHTQAFIDFTDTGDERRDGFLLWRNQLLHELISDHEVGRAGVFVQQE